MRARTLHHDVPAQDLFDAALRDPYGPPLWVLDEAEGTRRRVPVQRWLAPADDVDRAVLAGVRGPVLDVGCGPGRHLEALARRGVAAAGVDASRTAVRIARARGATALLRSVFGDVPWPGRWQTALLLDGNIGIGGDPVALVERVRSLLAPGGRVLVELARPAGPSSTAGPRSLRLERDGVRGPAFPWAWVPAGALPWAPVRQVGDRFFALT